MPFSKDTLDFLFENKINDSRSWFAEHKTPYQNYVLEPLRELVRALTPTMLELDKEFVVEPRVDKTICRIWRDTRYTHDPSLYRDHMWIIFKRGGKMHGTDFPGIYFEIGDYGFSYGCGFYHASTAYLNTMRSLILSGAPEFGAAERAYRNQEIYHLDGDCYKRPHFPDQPENLRDWLERRGISFNAESHDFELLFSDRLSEKLIADFKTLSPIYRFLLHTAEESLRAETASSLLQR